MESQKESESGVRGVTSSAFIEIELSVVPHLRALTVSLNLTSYRREKENRHLACGYIQEVGMKLKM